MIYSKVNKKDKGIIVFAAVQAAHKDTHDISYFVGIKETSDAPKSPTIENRLAENGWQILPEKSYQLWRVTVDLPFGFHYGDYTIGLVQFFGLYSDKLVPGDKGHSVYADLSPVPCSCLQQEIVRSAIEDATKNGIRLYRGDNSSEVARVISIEPM